MAWPPQSTPAIAGATTAPFAISNGTWLREATGDLVEVVLNSPHFLFRKELDVDRSRRLAPTQLLQALSYVVADAPPDRGPRVQEERDIRTESARQGVPPRRVEPVMVRALKCASVREMSWPSRCAETSTCDRSL